MFGIMGNFKGVEMIYVNLLFEGYVIDEVFGIWFGDWVMFFLLLVYIVDWMIGLYLQEMFGIQVIVVVDVCMIVVVFFDVWLIVWGVVFWVWEKFKVGIEFIVVCEIDEMKWQVLVWVMLVVGKCVNVLFVGEFMLDQLVVEWVKVDELVLFKLCEWLGFGELWWVLFGVVLIFKEMFVFFVGIGILIVEIWGMLELSCVVIVSYFCDGWLGIVGKLFFGLQGKIVEDGEYLVCGLLVMKGYCKELVKIVEVIDFDGWLYIGDVFDIDFDGYLWVVDCKKELIINVVGKNMLLVNIENIILVVCFMVGVMMVIGDG